MGSFVTEISPENSDIALNHFSTRLALETDCADVADAFENDNVDFVLLHVVGSKQTYAARNIPGSIHLPHREITQERMAQWPQNILFVVYCAGPHCNGADRAAVNLAKLGRPVKLMIGGITGWQDEGFSFAGNK